MTCVVEAVERVPLSQFRVNSRGMGQSVRQSPGAGHLREIPKPQVEQVTGRGSIKKPEILNLQVSSSGVRLRDMIFL